MRLTHQEKQQKRRELKLKGFTPEQVEIELSKIIKNAMSEENTPVEPEATPEVAPENEPVVPEAPVDTPVEPVA